MNVRDFEYIIEIANQRSISKAATSLFVSQPALSKYVQRMEESLGVRLFQRVGKQFILTYAGERCVEKARQILSLVRSSKNPVSSRGPDFCIYQVISNGSYRSSGTRAQRLWR